MSLGGRACVASPSAMPALAQSRHAGHGDCRRTIAGQAASVKDRRQQSIHSGTFPATSLLRSGRFRCSGNGRSTVRIAEFVGSLVWRRDQQHERDEHSSNEGDKAQQDKPALPAEILKSFPSCEDIEDRSDEKRAKEYKDCEKVLHVGVAVHTLGEFQGRQHRSPKHHGRQQELEPSDAALGREETPPSTGRYGRDRGLGGWWWQCGDRLGGGNPQCLPALPAIDCVAADFGPTVAAVRNTCWQVCAQQKSDRRVARPLWDPGSVASQACVMSARCGHDSRPCAWRQASPVMSLWVGFPVSRITGQR